MAGLVVPDKPYELAYEEARHAIEDQASVLEGLQARAGTLLAASAVVTSFFGAQAFARAAARANGLPSLHVVSYTGAAIAVFLVLALLALAALIPYGVAFSISGVKMLGVIEERRASGEPVGARETFVAVADQYQILYDTNRPTIRVPLVVFPQRYAVLGRRSRVVDRRLGKGEAVRHDRAGKPKPPKPSSPWGDLSNPDTRI